MTFIGQSQIVLNTPVVVPPDDFPPHPTPEGNDPAGIRSGVWKRGKGGPVYRSYRWFAKEEIRELSGTEIRQAARDLRADVRKDPLSEEVLREIESLARMVSVLADIDRLERSVAELTRAIEFAAEQRRKALQLAEDEEDEDISILLLS